MHGTTVKKKNKKALCVQNVGYFNVNLNIIVHKITTVI